MRLSSTQLSTFKSCPMKYKYKYIDKLELVEKQDDSNLMLGSLFHEYLENDLNVHTTDIDIPEKDIDMVYASASYYYNNIAEKSEREEIHEMKLESDFCLECQDTDCECEDKLPVIGYIDKVILDDKEGDTLIDYKFVSSTMYAETYAFSDQAKFYPLFYTMQTGRKVKELKFICICKPTIRLKKTETKEEYYERVKEWYTADKIIEVNVNDIEENKQNFLQELVYIKFLIDNKIFYKNYGSCNSYNKKCDYFDICSRAKSRLSEVDYKFKIKGE